MAKQDIVDEIFDVQNLGRRYWRNYHDSVDELIAFYDGQHFINQSPVALHERDTRLLEIVGQETFNVVRHMVSKYTQDRLTLSAKAVNQNAAPEQSEICEKFMEQEIYAPHKRFEHYLHRTIAGACVARFWILALDFDPTKGRWGEIVHRSVYPRRLMWEPPYDSPHDIGCGWVLEERYVPLKWVKKNKQFRFTRKLEPDQGSSQNVAWNRASRTGDGLGEASPDGGMGEPGKYVPGDFITLWFYWKRYDETIEAKEEDHQPVIPAQRRMACVGDPSDPDFGSCGYRTGTAEEAADDPNSEVKPGEDGEWPESIHNGCPDCEGDLQRIDATYPNARNSFTDGKRLVVYPPNGSSNRRAIYDGEWPVPEARSFPFTVIHRYVHMLKPTGSSDVLLNWTSQVASDAMVTTAVQRMMEHRNYYLTPDDGANDSYGNRFEYRNDQFNVIYMRQGTMMPTVMSGETLDPEFATVQQMLRDVLLSKQGIDDLGLSEANSKQIPVGTMQQLSQMGELPFRDFRQRTNMELSIHLGIIWDYMRATYPKDRIARLDLGVYGDVIAQLAGDDLPDMDFIIESGEPFQGIDDKIQSAFDSLMQVAQSAPDMVGIYAQMHRIPPSVTRQVMRVLAARQQQAQAAQQVQQQTQQGQQPEAGGSPLPGLMQQAQSSPMDSMIQGAAA